MNEEKAIFVQTIFQFGFGSYEMQYNAPSLLHEQFIKSRNEKSMYTK